MHFTACAVYDDNFPQYHALQNQFERIREIFERFEFLVCSKFNHMQRDCTCACSVACLHPHNSISNVVVGVLANMKPLWKIKGFFNRTSWKVSDLQIVRKTWVLVATDKSNHPVADSLGSVPQES